MIAESVALVGEPENPSMSVVHYTDSVPSGWTAVCFGDIVFKQIRELEVDQGQACVESLRRTGACL